MNRVERALDSLKKAAAERTREASLVAHVAPAGSRTESASVTHKGTAVGRFNPTRAVVFDMAALQEAGLYAIGNQRLAEEYRLIKRPLLRTAATGAESGHKRPNLIMVASALAGEGKTFTSMNLSISLSSEKDWCVLLVDVDCRNPRLSRLLGVGEEPGLLDYLRQPDVNFESLVLGTNVERLYLLPLGTQGEDAAELLASARMTDLCAWLSSGRDAPIVIFDSSPLLLTTESVILSGQIGQAVVVVKAHTTPRSAVTDALSKIDTTVAIGLILNGSNAEEHGLHYGDYGQYRYGSSE